MKRKYMRIMALTIIGILFGAGGIQNIIPIVSANKYIVSIENDYSFPQATDYDYGVTSDDIVFSDDNAKPGESITISANIHNDGLTRISSDVL